MPASMGFLASTFQAFNPDTAAGLSRACRLYEVMGALTTSPTILRVGNATMLAYFRWFFTGDGKYFNEVIGRYFSRQVTKVYPDWTVKRKPVQKKIE